jgi:pimeloyl-ACP methyl ester carboxylesterase
MKRQKILATIALLWTVSICQLLAYPEACSQVKYFRGSDELELGPSDARMRYSFFLPETHAGHKPAPLILALHFGGPVTPEIGRDFAEVLILPALSELEAVIVAPNCPGRGWTDPVSEDAVLRLLDRAKRRFVVDPEKTVIAGFSMGALGTYYLTARHPELFSAGIAVSAIPNAEDFSLLKDAALFAVQSTGDEIFGIEKARAAFEEMKKRGVRLETIFIEGVSHYQTSEYVPALKKAVPWLREIWGEGKRQAGGPGVESGQTLPKDGSQHLARMVSVFWGFFSLLPRASRIGGPWPWSGPGRPSLAPLSAGRPFWPERACRRPAD